MAIYNEDAKSYVAAGNAIMTECGIDLEKPDQAKQLPIFNLILSTLSLPTVDDHCCDAEIILLVYVVGLMACAEPERGMLIDTVKLKLSAQKESNVVFINAGTNSKVTH